MYICINDSNNDHGNDNDNDTILICFTVLYYHIL